MLHPRKAFRFIFIFCIAFQAQLLQLDSRKPEPQAFCRKSGSEKFANTGNICYNGSMEMMVCYGIEIYGRTTEKLDKKALIQLFFAQQEQLESIDGTLQLVLEQVTDLKCHRFGKSSEKLETSSQIPFMEVDGKIVFFNEAEAVAAETNTEKDKVPHKRPSKKKGRREQTLKDILVVSVEHTMTEKNLREVFAAESWKRLLNEAYSRYKFTPAKIEAENIMLPCMQESPVTESSKRTIRRTC